MVSLFFLFLFLIWPHLMAYRILVPQPGIESGPRQWKCRVLTTGPPGNSLVSLLNFSHYNRCVVVSHCILICISLMAEHLFMCLFTLLGAMSMFFVYFIIESLVLLFWICDLLDSVKLCSFFVGICLFYSPSAQPGRVKLKYYLKIKLNWTHLALIKLSTQVLANRQLPTNLWGGGEY